MCRFGHNRIFESNTPDKRVERRLSQAAREFNITLCGGRCSYLAERLPDLVPFSYTVIFEAGKRFRGLKSTACKIAVRLYTVA